MARLAAWFDIPVTDMARAVAFYSRITQQEMKRLPVGPGKETALFESDGCLFLAPEDQPSHFGSRVYFNADTGIEDWLSRVVAAGGKVLVPRTPIGGNRGFFAYFEDSEGNRVGLHGRSWLVLGCRLQITRPTITRISKDAHGLEGVVLTGRDPCASVVDLCDRHL